MDKRLLIISTQNRPLLKKMKLLDDDRWFFNILKTEIDEKQIDVIYAMNDELPDVNSLNNTIVIIGGSFFGVYEKINWIKKLEFTIQQLYEKNIPTLGVCFGHQIIVQALGGKVTKDINQKEFGNFKIFLNEKGMQDKLFTGINDEFLAMLGHSDSVIKLPPIKDIEVLAKSKKHAYQALAYGEKMRSIQFHPEITPEIMTKIALFVKNDLLEIGYFKTEDVFNTFLKNIKSVEKSKLILKNFYKYFE